MYAIEFLNRKIISEERFIKKSNINYRIVSTNSNTLV